MVRPGRLSRANTANSTGQSNSGGHLPQRLRRSREALRMYLALRTQVAQIARRLIREIPPADLVHDICVDVTLSKPRFRRDSAYSTWIHSIVCHRVHNWIRKQRSQRNLLRAATEVALRQQAPQPDAAMDSVVMVAELRTGLAMLTEGQRACLILVGCEALSPKEAAVLLRLTPTAVRMNVCRARARLRTWFAKETVEVEET